MCKGEHDMQKKISQNEYVRRINLVQDYIDSHISESFTLEELSSIAGFSKYHFHRIFKAVTQVSLLQYVNRIKLQKSAQLLGQRLDMSITDIAYHMGFTDSAVFSRSFKQMYQVSPSQYRNDYRKNCKEQYNISRYNLDVSKINNKDIREGLNAHVEIVELDEISVAYLRFTGTYSELAKEFPNLLESLFVNAEKQSLINGHNHVIAMYHDHPEFTQPDYFKTSLGMTISHDARTDESNELSFLKIPAGKYIVGHFYIQQDLYSVAWDYIYEEWLTTSGYAPRDSAPFEMYMNDYRTDKNHMHKVDIYLPVQPL